MPAGAIEPGENPAQAIVWEVREETGLKVKRERIVGVFGGNGFRLEYSNGDQVEYTVGLLERARRPSVGCFDTEETPDEAVLMSSWRNRSEQRAIRGICDLSLPGLRGRPTDRAPGKLSADNSDLARAEIQAPGPAYRVTTLIPYGAEIRTALLVSIREAALNKSDGYPGVVASALSGCSTIGNAKLPESFGLNLHFRLTQLQISSSAAFKPLLCDIEADTTAPRFTPIAILHGIGCPRPIARSCLQVPFTSGRGELNNLAASALYRPRLKTRNKMGKARATRA
jgi:ADP-ribose pyrophosphatase YjhB (NUDIX family)